MERSFPWAGGSAQQQHYHSTHYGAHSPMPPHSAYPASRPSHEGVWVSRRGDGGGGSAGSTDSGAPSAEPVERVVSTVIASLGQEDIVLAPGGLLHRGPPPPPAQAYSSAPTTAVVDEPVRFGATRDSRQGLSRREFRTQCHESKLASANDVVQKQVAAQIWGDGSVPREDEDTGASLSGLHPKHKGGNSRAKETRMGLSRREFKEQSVRFKTGRVGDEQVQVAAQIWGDGSVPREDEDSGASWSRPPPPHPGGGHGGAAGEVWKGDRNPGGLTVPAGVVPRSPWPISSHMGGPPGAGGHVFHTAAFGSSTSSSGSAGLSHLPTETWAPPPSQHESAATHVAQGLGSMRELASRPDVQALLYAAACESRAQLKAAAESHQELLASVGRLAQQLTAALQRVEVLEGMVAALSGSAAGTPV